MKNQLSKQVVNSLKQNKTTGIVALAGIGLGALAFLGYKRIPEDKKTAFKSKLDNAGKKVKETYSKVESSIVNSGKEASKKVEQATS